MPELFHRIPKTGKTNTVKRIAVLTSGGDAPGMNAAIRAVVRTAGGRGVEILGIMHGYEGLMNGEIQPMESKSVGGIIAQGGTILRSSRSQGFREPEGREKALSVLKKHKIEGLVVIGGDGSLAGALTLQEERSFPVYGVPASIDNDIAGTDFSIGFDTAVNTAVEAIDRVRDTAYSHERVFVIEVMGKHNGFIAVEAGLAAGAEAILIPEVTFNLVDISADIQGAAARGKRSCIIVTAEGAARAADVKDFIERHAGFDARYLVLGHMQRGGSPTAFDRVLALRLGSFAANRLIDGNAGEMAGVDGQRTVANSLGYVLGTEKSVDPSRLSLAYAMAH